MLETKVLLWEMRSSSDAGMPSIISEGTPATSVPRDSRVEPLLICLRNLHQSKKHYAIKQHWAEFNTVTVGEVFTWKPEAVMAEMIELACSWFQLPTLLRLDTEDISWGAGTDVIWLLVRPALAFPRFSNTCGVIVRKFDARAADTWRNRKYTEWRKKPDDTLLLFRIFLKSYKVSISICCAGYNETARSWETWTDPVPHNKDQGRNELLAGELRR